MHVQIPVSMYRLQFNRDFTFRDATKLVPYLAQLGITHCYASPYLRARPGSMHGYDIIDHNSLNPEIGTPAEYDEFVNELHRYGLGQVLDIVPNHMGVMGSDNAWWLDVLENGEASAYAEFFDIDWDPIKDELQGKVLVPILGDQYGNVLEKGELKLVFDAERGEFSIFYYQHRFPINPREYPRILRFQLEDLESRHGSTHEDVLELQSIATAFGHLPSRENITPEKAAERNREKEVQKRRLAALCARSADICGFLRRNVEQLNGTPGEPRGFDALHELIKAQAYRLAQWRVAADDINYRRFFDINDLAALRTNNSAVFAATHRFIFELVTSGKVNGLRIDHPDGLYDPASYFSELQKAIADSSGETRPFYVVAEKILTGDEQLRKEWAIYGTTGYEFANLVNGLFVDPSAAQRMERIYRSFTGRAEDIDDLVYDCKRLILKVALASELNVLATALSRIALANRHTCDFTLNSLRSALSEVIASFPVYRTYVASEQVSPEDRRYIEHAVASGAKRSNLPDPSVFDFIRRVLLIDSNGDEPRWYRNAFVRFTMKFQQVTSAVMAKGLEDTAFYRYNRLASLNEVGGDPTAFGVSVEKFHTANEQRLRCWPHSALATSTHDSKRSEDVRARIDVLSEIPAQWRAGLRRWRDWNRSKKRAYEGMPAPDRNHEYLFYQTLLGAWPENLERWDNFVERMQQYMFKAIREGKEHSSWSNPNAQYESAVSDFVRGVLDRKRKNRFLRDFEEFQAQVSRIGALNSLSQTLLKLTCPGVPDLYQGNELLDFSLVDPDNRRPVDYSRRQNLLQQFLREEEEEDEAGCEPGCRARSLLNTLGDGRAKLFVTMKALRFRRQHTALFQKGRYLALPTHGPASDHLCAFAREFEHQVAIVAVPRLCAALTHEKEKTAVGQVWGDTLLRVPLELGYASFRNVLTGEEVTLKSEEVNDAQQGTIRADIVFANFPVALLFADKATDG